MVSKKQESGVKIRTILTAFLPIFGIFCNFVPRKRKKTENENGAVIPIEHIQFAAITLTGFLTLMLVFILPLHGKAGQVYNRSRWFMVAGTALLPVQFLLQYTLHFRQMGVEPPY